MFPNDLKNRKKSKHFLKKCTFFIVFQNDRDIVQHDNINQWYIHQNKNTKKIFWNKKCFFDFCVWCFSMNISPKIFRVKIFVKKKSWKFFLYFEEVIKKNFMIYFWITKLWKKNHIFFLNEEWMIIDQCMKCWTTSKTKCW